MSRGLLFWIIMLLVLIGALWFSYPNYGLMGMSAVVWILLALLGWKVFGPPIRGD